MDKFNIEQLMISTEDDVAFMEELSKKLVISKTKTLDDLMECIQANIIDQPTVLDNIIEQYLLELTNAIYFVSAQTESFGFYDDISKVNARNKYNEAYAENQLNSLNNNKKATVNDNTLYAEQKSVDENILNLIYSRSNKIVKSKVEAASEMVRTLSKILSVHMNNRQSNIILDKE